MQDPTTETHNETLNETHNETLNETHNETLNETHNETTIKATYIDDDQLQRDFTLCNTSNTYKVHCVVYSTHKIFIEGDIELDEIKTNYYNTYLYNKYYDFNKYAMKLSDEKWTFETFEYKCPVIGGVGVGATPQSVFTPAPATAAATTEEEPAQETTHFETQCYNTVISMLKTPEKIHQVSNLQFYKGFIEHGDHEIYAFFDIGELYSDLLDTYKSVLMSEYLDYKCTSYNIPISEEVCEFFRDHKTMHKLRTDETQTIPLPRAMYLCEFMGEGFVNISGLVGGDITKYYYNYEPLVPGFYFTELVQYDKGLEDNLKLVKCAVFIVNSLDLGLEIDKLVREDGDHDYLFNAQTICFLDGGIKMCAVKNVSHFSVL